MVTWGVTDAGVGRCRDGPNVDIVAADWVGHSPTRTLALDDDDRTATISVGTREDAPITGSTTRLTIPATTARLVHGEETTRLADHTFPLSDGSYRLSCRPPSTPAIGARAADAWPAFVTQFQGPATVERTEEAVQCPFEQSRSVTLVAARRQPAVLRLGDRPGGYHVTYDPVSTKTNGGWHECPFDGAARLCGDSTETSVSAVELDSVLERTALLVAYDGAFHWSTDLANRS